MSVNPFTPGSKRHDLAERILKGDSSDKIVKDLKLNSKQPIYQLNTAWKKIRAKAKAEEEKKIPFDTDENSSPAQGPIFRPQALTVPPRIGAQGGNVIQVEGFAPGKQVNLTPPNLTMIHWFMSKYNYEGDLSDFLNDAVEDFFRSRNWRIKIVQEEIV